MALIPEYLYPDYPGSLVFKDDQYKIGIQDNTNILFGDVLEVDLSDFDILIHTEQNPYKLTLLEYDNGLKLEIVMGYSAYSGALAFNAHWIFEGTDQQAPSGTSRYSQYLNYAGNHYSKTDYSKMYISFTTAYPANPIENLTPASNISLTVWFDTEYTTYVDLDLVSVPCNLGSKIGSNINTSWTTIYHTYYGDTEVEVSPVIFTFATITDFEAFDAYMKNAGRGQTDPVFNPERDPEEDTSGPGGGGGSYDPSSDPIDFPDLPIGGALTSGMIKGFVISSTLLQQLQDKLWNMSIFDIATQFQKLVNQPLDCLISLHALPVLPTTGNSEEIKLGSFPTGINGIRITNQYLEVDAGNIKVPLYWGSALDYAPYTRCEIYLPFIGFRNLQIEDIQGLTLVVKYHVDVLTGDCVAYIKCGQSVLYTFTGNCLQHIPCTSSTSDLLAKNISAVGMVGIGLATGQPAAAVAGAASGAINSATAKNHVQRTGEVAGSPGIMSEFTPYLLFHRPKQSLAKNYNKFKGYPSNITYKLSTLSGYTEVEHVHLTGINATDAELNEIERLLKEGVLI